MLRTYPLVRIASLLVILWYSAMAVGCITPPPKPEQPVRGDYGYVERYLTWSIPREMDRAQVHGLSIALIDDQRVVWSQGFGYAYAERKVPATDRTIYGIGSITKLFTATAVMQLAEQGRIDLDAPLTRYVPEFSIRSRFTDATPITVRNLLTHHSGLPGDHLKGMWSLHPAPFAQVIPLLKDEYASYPPNMVYSYSSIGYTLLGEIVERASGQKYADYIQKAVLTPLGMDHSSFDTQPDREPLLAVGYRKGKPGAERYYLRDAPAGALFSNAQDMGRFVRMVFADGQVGEHSILHPDTLREMWRAQNTDVALDMDYRMGLGWMLDQPVLAYAGPVVHHSGGTLGTASELMLLPQHKLGVVVLANSPAGSTMINGVAVQALKLALEAKSGIREPSPQKPVNTASAVLSSDELSSLAGNYAGNFGAVLPVTNKGSYLQTEFQGSTFALLPQTNETFAVQYRLFGWIPITIDGLRSIALSAHDIAGRKVIAINYAGKRILAGVRIVPRPLPQSWLQLVGRYSIVNKGEDGTLVENLELAHENGVLMLKYTLPEAPGFKPSIALEPISADEAISAGLGRFMGDTFRVVTVEGERRMLYSGYQLRRVTGSTEY